MTRIGLLTGLAREAAVIERAAARTGLALDVGLGGADPARTRAEAHRLAGEGPDLLVSFGFAGGLDPALRPGVLVLPETIHDPEGGRWAVAPDWHGALLAGCPDAQPGTAVVGVDAAVTTPRGKRGLAEATGAAVVDMESVALARAAADADVPMIVVRALCDPAERAIPEAVASLLDVHGRLRCRPLPALLPHLPSLAALAADSARATRGLRRGASRLVQVADARGRPTAS